MKARIIATGEIKVFYPARQSGHDGYVDEQGLWYYPNELDFRNGGVPIPEAEYKVGTIWIAREEDGNLIAFSENRYGALGNFQDTVIGMESSFGS